MVHQIGTEENRYSLPSSEDGEDIYQVWNDKARGLPSEMLSGFLDYMSLLQQLII